LDVIDSLRYLLFKIDLTDKSGSLNDYQIIGTLGRGAYGEV
jgi:hypothetical protein